MDSLTLFEAKANPLGSEIDLFWEYPETSISRYKLYIFKSSSPIDNLIIQKYAKNPIKENVPEGVFVWKDLDTWQKSLQDFEVLEKKIYYYKTILVNLNDTNDISDIQSVEIENPKFTINMQVVPTKKMVIEGLEKLLSAILRTTKAKLMVYNEFPLDQLEGAWLIVTRASGEVAHRFWSNLISSDAEFKTGEIDADMIQVVWMCSKSASLRDELTDFFRGTRRFLERFCRHRYEGVRDVFITIGADGADTSIPGRAMPYGSMIINFLIENQMIIPKGDLEEEIIVSFDFTTESDVEKRNEEYLETVEDEPTTEESLPLEN